MALNDAPVIAGASFPSGPGTEPVVAEVTDDFSTCQGRPLAALHLKSFELMATKRQLGVLIAFVDLALAPTGMIGPSDSPLVAMLGGLGHLPCSYLEQGRRTPETNRPSVSGRVVWPQNGPKKRNAHEGLSQVRVIVGCGGPLRTALSGGVWGADGGGDCCVACCDDFRVRPLRTRAKSPAARTAAATASGSDPWRFP
jgi:hypothetical protein